MNFEQLLDGATQGPWKEGNEAVWADINGEGNSPSEVCTCYEGPTTINAEYIARLGPTVMREVWAALNGAVTRLSVLVETGQATLPEEQTYKQCKRSLALLDGQTEKGGAE